MRLFAVRNMAGVAHDLQSGRAAAMLNQHLRLATGLDYLDACPVRGTRLGGGGEIMLTNAEVREHSQQAQQQ